MATITLNPTNDSVSLSQGPVYRVNTGSKIGWSGETLDGAAGVDTVYVDAGYNTPDYFSLSMSHDGIVTFTAASGAGSPTLSFVNFEKMVFWDVLVDLGTAGNDTITGISANETIYGFDGNDIIDGGAGTDKMYGGAGKDTYTLSAATDIVGEKLGEGADTIKAGFSYSLVDTDGSGADGGNVENLILLGTGNFAATGNKLANTLTGNTGANILTGGLAKDILFGKGGADTFDYNAINESMVGAKHDIIKDFVHASDKIDLSTIDAKTTVAGNDSFTLLANFNDHFTGTPTTPHAGELRFGDMLVNGVANGNTVVEGDVNGDGIADFQIEIAGKPALTAIDFIL